MRPRVILDLDLAQSLWALSRSSRQQIVRTLDLLAESPFVEGEAVSLDETGRNIHHRTFGRWRFSYWLDGPVNELRIIHIRRDS